MIFTDANNIQVPSSSKHQAKTSLGSKAINDGQKTAKTKFGPQGDE